MIVLYDVLRTSSISGGGLLTPFFLKIYTVFKSLKRKMTPNLACFLAMPPGSYNEALIWKIQLNINLRTFLDIQSLGTHCSIFMVMEMVDTRYHDTEYDKFYTHIHVCF